MIKNNNAANSHRNAVAAAAAIGNDDFCSLWPKNGLQKMVKTQKKNFTEKIGIPKNEESSSAKGKKDAHW